MFSRLRARVAASIERGDASPGFRLGLLCALVVAIAFSTGCPPAVRADLTAYDLALAARQPRQAHPDLVLVEIDETTRRGAQISRETYGKVLRSLEDLGARWIGFDVEFGDQPGFDVNPIEWTARTEFFRKALELSGNAIVAFRCDPVTAWSEHRDAVLRVADLLRRKPDADVVAEAAGLGLSPDDRAALVAAPDQFWRLGFWLLVDETMSKDPEASAEALRARLLTPQIEEGQAHLVREVEELRRAWLTLRASSDRGVPVSMTSKPPRVADVPVPSALHPDLVKAARDFGFVVTPSHDIDGVLRRAPLVNLAFGRPKVYLGAILGAHHLEDDATRSEMTVSRDELTLHLLDRTSGAERRRLRIPLHPDGSAWADFCGERGDWGRRGPHFFSQVPLLRFSEYYDLRWDGLYAKANALVDLMSNYELPEWAESLSRAWARRRKALYSPDEPASRLPELERELDALVDRAIPELGSYLAERRQSAERLPAASRGPMVEHLDRALALHALLVKQKQEIAAARTQLESRVKGKTCLIGLTARHGSDQHATPMSVAAPGVEVHITAANMILTDRFLRTAPSWATGIAIFFAGTVVAWVVTYRSAMAGFLVAASLAGVSAAGYLLALDRLGVVLSAPGPMFSIAGAFLFSLLYRQLVTLRAQKRLQRELESKMSPEVVKVYLENPEAFTRPRRVVGTVFFSDVKGFTSISEKMPPEQLVTFINRYLDRMTRILMDHTAYIDKYIGDGIMALFGAPIEDPRHALRACGAALACLRAVDELNGELRQEGLPELSIRVGLHSGEVVSAKIGSRARADLTAMGDTVNLASRLEGANKYYGTGIMISEATWAMVEGQFQARELDNVRVVGKQKAVKVFELLAAAGKPSPLSPDFLAAFDLGLEAYRERRWNEAARQFDAARALRPNDGPCWLYLQRIAACQMNEPPGDWQPIHSLEGK